MDDPIWFSLITLSPLAVLAVCAILSSIPDALRNIKKRRCIHLWRRMDADYSNQETLYRYHCVKCKLDRELWEDESKRFEDDFMSDY